MTVVRGHTLATVNFDPDELVDTAQVAVHIGLCPHTVLRMRKNRSGPPFIRVGNSIRYRWRDVEAWLNECTERA
jgi:predicted DNA-binding transcriptional regulator AlpA